MESTGITGKMVKKISDNNILGVIPARGGSKGIPGKNIYPLNGKPLINYSIETALQAKMLTKCIVSTDSEEIAKVARDAGAEVPFTRPASLASDSSLSVDVMKHALITMDKLDGKLYTHLVMLQPTTPFRTAKDIDKSVELLLADDCDSVMTLVDVKHNHPARMYTINDGMLSNVMAEGVPMRPRQELPKVYIRSGDIYACKRELLFEKNVMIGSKCVPLVISSERAVNIDTMEDLLLTEYYLKNLEAVEGT